MAIRFFGHLLTVFPNYIPLGGSPEFLSSLSLKKQMRKSPSPNPSVVYMRILLFGQKFAAFPFFIFCLQKNT